MLINYHTRHKEDTNYSIINEPSCFRKSFSNYLDLLHELNLDLPFLAVIMCVTSSLLVYWVTRILEGQRGKDSHTPVKVKFDISFFLVVAAGASAVMATASSLVMHCYLHRTRQRTRSEEELSLDLLYSMLPADSFADIPPPAYSP